MEKEPYTIWYDPNPELWDEYIPKDLKDKIELSKQFYERKGRCNRCGSCCYWLDRDGKRQPCKYLEINLGIAKCTIYGQPERPQRCINFPPKPDVSNKHPLCGFYFEIKKEITKEEGKDLLDNMCALCSYDVKTCERKKENETELDSR